MAHAVERKWRVIFPKYSAYPDFEYNAYFIGLVDMCFILISESTNLFCYLSRKMQPQQAFPVPALVAVYGWGITFHLSFIVIQDETCFYFGLSFRVIVSKI